MTAYEHKKFLGIQALRIVAAFLVLVTHSTYYVYERLDKHFFVWERGTRGVDIFFVISGFVMIFSSQRLWQSRGGWKLFAQHRIVRIVPIYWLVTTLKIAVMLAAAGLALHAKLNFATGIASYLFLPARNLDGKIEPLVAVGWTLNYEMLFYFLFTLALFLERNVVVFVGIVLALLSAGSLFGPYSSTTAAFYFNSIVLEFFFGMLVAKASINNKYVPQRIAPLLCAVGLLLLLLPPFESQWPKILISGVPSALIVWSAASFKGFERFIPRSMIYLGDASYSIYLIHPFVCPLPPALLNRAHLYYPSFAVLLSVLLGLAAGCALHQFIEIPMTNSLRAYLKARRDINYNTA
jgi:peptidoglycan/LPS O-acetylase OafA/YrhL